MLTAGSVGFLRDVDATLLDNDGFGADHVAADLAVRLERDPGVAVDRIGDLLHGDRSAQEAS